MKRLLDEPDCTELERALLASVDLDGAPSPLLVERVRAAVAREETAFAPVFASRRHGRARGHGLLAAALLLPIAAAFAWTVAPRRPHEEARREPPAPEVAPPAAVPAPEERVLELVAPAAEAARSSAPVASASASAWASPSAHPSASAPPRRDPDCDPPYVIGSDGRKRYKLKCLDDGAYVPRPFDRGAAATALASVDLRGCEKYSGADGTAHVTVIFDTGGTVSSAVVDSGAFVGAGRAVCAAQRFRAVTVPAFDGPPVRVGKTFSIP